MLEQFLNQKNFCKKLKNFYNGRRLNWANLKNWRAKGSPTNVIAKIKPRRLYDWLYMFLIISFEITIKYRKFQNNRMAEQ